VFIHGEIWDAVAPAGVALGEKVVVERVDGMQLRVASAKTEVPSREKTSV